MASVFEVILVGLMGYDIGRNGWDSWRTFVKRYLIIVLVISVLLACLVLLYSPIPE